MSFFFYYVVLLDHVSLAFTVFVVNLVVYVCCFWTFFDLVVKLFPLRNIFFPPILYFPDINKKCTHMQ